MNDNVAEIVSLAKHTAVRAGQLCYAALMEHQFEQAMKHMGMYLDCCAMLVRLGQCSDLDEAERMISPRFPDGFHRFVSKDLSLSSSLQEAGA